VGRAQRQFVALASAALLFGATASAAAAPQPGRYAAQLCVTLPAAEPSCGEADLEWRRAGRARVRISDIVYNLQLKTSQVDVVLLHGAMQIDSFTAIYEWDGDTLRFVDADKNVRYEVRPGAAR
jgi:hypothetical protein